MSFCLCVRIELTNHAINLHKIDSLNQKSHRRGSSQDLRETSPDRSTLGRKQRFVFCTIVDLIELKVKCSC